MVINKVRGRSGGFKEGATRNVFDDNPYATYAVAIKSYISNKNEIAKSLKDII